MSKKISRRKFLKMAAGTGAAVGASMILPWKMMVREAWAEYGVNSPNLAKFIQPLRSIGPAGVFSNQQVGIPVAVADGAGIAGAAHYTIAINQFSDLLHQGPASSTIWGPTTLWGYNPINPASAGGTPTQRHLGGVIATLKNSAVQITFRNNLPPTHIIPVDTTIPGAGLPQNRTATHLHGGHVPWISDGGPFDWWTPNGQVGPSFLNNVVLNPGAAQNEAEYYYPNDSSARLQWYHDHAFGITRLNAYAGIASGYVITDTNAEENFVVSQGVPGPLDPKTFYMVFQDKIFIPNGNLFYANIYDFALFGPPGVPSFGEPFLSPPPIPSVVPEFFGDTILVNGTVYPFMEVEQKRYRFRMLNACNARFLNPRLVYAQSNVIGSVGSTEPSNNKTPATSFLQIGTEGGFLPAPVLLSTKPNGPHVLMAPAERADMIVDFSNVPAGSVLLLYNDAPGPFPGGGAVFDHYPQNPKTPTSIPGFGPNTRTLLQVRVKASAPDPVLTLTMPPLDPTLLVPQTAGVPNVPIINRNAGTASVTGGPQNVVFRSLTLNEGFDEYGRLAQFIGTNVQAAGTTPGFFGRTYLDTPTETPAAGAVEIWEIANLTADTHPIHFHLVTVEILARQPFSVKSYAGIPNLYGRPAAPDLNELGWKETVRMNPGEVIWVIMQFDLPSVPFNVPGSPRLAAPPYNIPNANEYVWHCHILEHEEHDMMRPLIVI